jgi:hypothetical protein
MLSEFIWAGANPMSAPRIRNRRSTADSAAQLAALRADIERVVAEGLVSAVRRLGHQWR